GARITVPLAMYVGWCLQVSWAIGTNVRSRINQLRARLGTATRPPADEAAARLSKSQAMLWMPLAGGRLARRRWPSSGSQVGDCEPRSGSRKIRFGYRAS